MTKIKYTDRAKDLLIIIIEYNSTNKRKIK